MNEVFDSEKIYVEYKKDDDIVLVVLKGKVTRDAFRTPMMHAADMVMRHSCKVLVVQFDADPELNEKDINWSTKILFNNLKKSGLEKLVLITAEPREIVKKTATFAGGRFKTIISKSYEEVKAKLDSSL